MRGSLDFSTEAPNCSGAVVLLINLEIRNYRVLRKEMVSFMSSASDVVDVGLTYAKADSLFLWALYHRFTKKKKIDTRVVSTLLCTVLAMLAFTYIQRVYSSLMHLQTRIK